MMTDAHPAFAPATLPPISGCGDPACPGWGWFDGNHVERCDACDAFQDDEEAAASIPNATPFSDGDRILWTVPGADKVYRLASLAALHYRQGEIERHAGDLVAAAQQLEGFVVAGPAPGNTGSFHHCATAVLLALAEVHRLQGELDSATSKES